MKPVTCKFLVQSITRYQGNNEQIKASAVGFVPGETPENESFSQYTPTGDLVFTVTNPNVIGTIQPGQFIYLTLSPALA